MVGAVAFPVIVWLVMYFDAGQSAKAALGGAIVATVLFALFGLFLGTLKPLLAASNPLMGLLLAGGHVPIISVVILCSVMFLFEIGVVASVFPKLNSSKGTTMCFLALWMAMGTFSFLAKGAVIPGLIILCVGVVFMLILEFVSRRFECLQDYA